MVTWTLDKEVYGNIIEIIYKSHQTVSMKKSMIKLNKVQVYTSMNFYRLKIF